MRAASAIPILKECRGRVVGSKLSFSKGAHALHGVAQLVICSHVPQGTRIIHVHNVDMHGYIFIICNPILKEPGHA
jgi:hypothetical protein